MGSATITANQGEGLYDVTLTFSRGKIPARLAAIAVRLTELATLMSAAQAAVEAAVIAVKTAENGVSLGIVAQPKSSLTAVPRWYNAGKGTCTGCYPGDACRVGTYSLTCMEVVHDSPAYTRFIVRDPFMNALPDAMMGTAYVHDQINFTINDGDPDFESGDAFDIAVTEVTVHPVESSATAQGKLVAALANLAAKRRALSVITLEKIALEKEQTRLNAVPQSEARAGVWCTDYTTDKAAGATVGTMEITGTKTQVIITPGGAAGIGILQPAAAGTPSGTFVNLAKFPGWQRWKPTYRVGELKAIDYTTHLASVCIDDAQSSSQGLAINPSTGAECSQICAAVAGFTDFAARYPGDPLVANTASTEIKMSSQLMADIAAVNAEVNDRNHYVKDIDRTGAMDRWDYMDPGGSGDCEDFALTKARLLLRMGYPASAIHIEVGTTQLGAGHAWLVIQTESGDWALDINYQNPMPAGALDYTDRRRQTGTSWSRSGILYENVPIEYMDGMNSGAFEVGDRVVVQLVGQSWSSPKVIGFETNPRAGMAMYIGYGDLFRGATSIGKYGFNGSIKEDPYLAAADIQWTLPYSIFNGEIYVPREMIEGEGTPWQDCLKVRVFDLKTKALKRTLLLHFFHVPAFTGDNAALFEWVTSPLGQGGIGGLTHGPTGTLYFSCAWHSFTGFVAWIRSGIYAFNHLTGADAGYYQYTGFRRGLPGGGQPGPIQE